MQTQEIALTGIGVLPDRLRRLNEAKVAELAESMQQCGLLQPIVLRPMDGSGFWLVAGRHRYEAAKHLHWDAITAIVVEGMQDAAAELAEIDENLIRGELSPAERSIHIAQRKRLYETLHPETKHGGAPGRAGGGKKAKEANFASFQEDTATKTKRSKRGVRLDATRAKHIPQIAACIGTSLDQGDELDALAKLSPEAQAPIIEAAQAGGKVSAKGAVKRVRRAAKEASVAEQTQRAAEAIGTKLYGVIYADPPWRFEPYSRDTGLDRAADNHYPTMDLDAIKALKIPAADDCMLFLWATAPMLPQALDVMAAWGFSYRSHCIWSKDRAGTGYWFRSRHELLLVGMRGHMPAPAPGDQYPSVIDANVQAHSVKPSHFTEMIEAMFPSAELLEMFARSPRAGWDSWGNEVGKAAA